MNIEMIFNAGRVRRWHSDPDMSWTDDYNDGHQGRVARLLLALHPNPCVLLIAAALTHDDGELVAGDMGAVAKRAYPDARAALQVIEDRTTCEMWGIPETPTNCLSPDNLEWLKFADRLDGYMWMMRKASHLAKQADWKITARQLETFARKHSLPWPVHYVFKTSGA